MGTVSLEALLERAREIRDEKIDSANTAYRVGKLLEDMINGTSSSVLDEKYLSKLHDDSTPFNLTIGQLLTTLNLKVTDVARIARAVIEVLGTEKFVDGFFGEGYQIWKAAATGDWNFTIDRATFRKTLTVFELLIQKLRSIKGALVISPADGKIKTVETDGTSYKITFEDDNSYTADDYMRMQVYTGAGNKDAVRYYWVKVDHVDGNIVYVPITEFDGVVPLVGDETVQIGNLTNTLRQALIFLSATEDGTPRIDLLDGVNSKNFDGCLKVRLGRLDGITDSTFPSDISLPDTDCTVIMYFSVAHLFFLHTGKMFRLCSR